jgi:hypothetical protein
MHKLKVKKSPGQKPQLPKGHYGFVIGNGSSRKDLNIEQLMDYGLLFGCNWFFKEEFRPHVLVASDEPMTRTILKSYSQYPKSNWFYTWYPKPGSGAKKATTPEKFAAGPMATHLAAYHFESPKIFLIGMDFFGFGSKDKNDNGLMNNLYEGMKHYAKIPESETVKNGAPTYRNWQRRYQWIISRFSDTEFYHVNPFEGKSPEKIRGFSNFHQITFENLIDHLQNDAELVDILEKTDEDIKMATEINEDNIRACLERQLVGQENCIYPDLIDPQEVLNLRVNVSKQYEKILKEKGSIEGYELGIEIAGHQLIVPPCVVKEGNIQRMANVKEIEKLFNQENVIRHQLAMSSEVMEQKFNIDLTPKKKKKSSMGLPPPPPPPGMDLPPPPPPPTL